MKIRRPQLIKATAQWLAALGYPNNAAARTTTRRVADLWIKHLLAGEDIDLSSIVKPLPSANDGIVALCDLRVHLVCPHHLTVAFGVAQVAYVPQGFVAPLGQISRLVSAATSRLVLQESAVQDIAQHLAASLKAAAVLVSLEATHPCHAIPIPQAHAAKLVSYAFVGNKKERRALMEALRRSTTRRSR